MNYIGSKFSLLDFIHNTISQVTGYENGEDYIFADLFAGTGVVGASYRKQGCRVISNDIQYYSYVLNRYFIQNETNPDFELLNYLNSLSGIDGFVYNNYCSGSQSGRNYFTDENGRKCDAIRIELEKLYLNNNISKETYFYFLASLINSIDKYANTASVYGAFLKHVKKAAQKSFKLELLPFINGIKGQVYNEDINTLINNIYGDVLYLDPPYNSRQYCANYHVLETIARYDNPILKGKTGLRNYDGQKSNYCSKRKIVKEFDQLIRDAQFHYIFLSYNNEGLMSVDTIENIMAQYGEYRCYKQKHKRFKADKDENRNTGEKETVEYLHCLIK